MMSAVAWSWRFSPTGQVLAHLDADAAELVGRADAGQHQQLRRLVGAGGDDHLALGPDLSAAAAADSTPTARVASNSTRVTSAR